MRGVARPKDRGMKAMAEISRQSQEGFGRDSVVRFVCSSILSAPKDNYTRKLRRGTAFRWQLHTHGGGELRFSTHITHGTLKTQPALVTEGTEPKRAPRFTWSSCCLRGAVCPGRRHRPSEGDLVLRSLTITLPPCILHGASQPCRSHYLRCP